MAEHHVDSWARDPIVEQALGVDAPLAPVMAMRFSRKRRSNMAAAAGRGKPDVGPTLEPELSPLQPSSGSVPRSPAS